MLKKIILLFSLFWGFFTQAQDNRPYVVLISFDGFRSDYVEKLDLPNFKAFIKGGTKAEYIVPSFPSTTFPNHYTIATGMYPGNHGIVDNSFYDAAQKITYSSYGKEVTNPYFYSETPLWSLARQSGVKSASYFWVGSDQTDPSKDPDYYYKYVDSVSFKTRVKQVLTWLQLPEKDRPHLIMLYFSSPDHESHDYGPWSDQTKVAIRKMDILLGSLMQGLDELHLPINTILVSDHGMAEVKVEPSSYVFLDELFDVDAKGIKVLGHPAQQHVYVEQKEKIDSLFNLLKQKEKNYTVLKNSGFPKEWHYQNDRVGDILISAAPNYILRKSGREAFFKNIKFGTLRGEHGYDPAKVADMHAIFYAKGPNIKPGLTIPPFQNVDIFPLVARILELKLPKIDGNPETLQKVYRK